MRFFAHALYANTWIATSTDERFSVVLNKEDDGWAVSVTDHSGECPHVEHRKLPNLGTAQTNAIRTIANLRFGRFAG